MEYDIIDELGNGMFGTVYKIKYKNNYFAMKIEHILNEDIIKNIKSQQWREIDFINKFGKKYKDQFIRLYSYDFVDSCKHIQKYPVNLKNFDKKNRDKIIKLSKSKTCIRKIYELVDGNVKDLLPKLNQQQIYSFILQVSIIVDILQKAKYIHGDFHSGNIGYIKTDKQFIKYKNLKIPTYGYIFKAIDYGYVMHPKYKLGKDDKKWYKDLYKRELITPLLTSLIDFTEYWDYVEDNNIKLNFKKYMKKLEKTDIFKITQLQFPNITNKQYIFNITEILYPDEFQKIILDKKYIKTLVPRLFIDILDIIYLFNINFDPDKIIKYFILKL
jgi:hypothetical protein